MKVIILAAGVGSRLMPLTRNTPKSLLDLGNGYTLLERQLSALREAGLREIVLVTGYRSEQIEAKVKTYTDFDFELVYNPFYRLANNLPSAWMGLKDRDEPTMLINGDDLFQSSVVQKLMASDKEITLVVSRKDEYDDDDMKVILDDERIVDVGKDIPLADANGESIGMMLFQGRGLRDIQAMLTEMIRVEENLQLFYLHALRQLMKRGHAVHYVECGPDDWAEVDFHPDLELMRTHLKLNKMD
jgi:choline kinase